MRSACICLTMLLSLSAPLQAGENGAAFKALRTSLRSELASGFYSAQLLGELDRPVEKTIKLAELVIPARVGERGQLELDLRGNGHFTKYMRDQSVTLSLKRADAKRSLSIRIHLTKKDDGMWTYRNVTQLTLQAGSDQLVLVDVNGNGHYNEPGVDGITLRDQKYLFPLPASDERWCTLTQELTGLTMGPWGEDVKVNGRPLTTRTPAALDVLRGVIEERLKLGLTPRPEDPKLSSDLQKHCAYMSKNNKLAHPEDKGKPGYSPEGHKAGKRSILSAGTPPSGVARMMVNTYYHRIDVVRPDTIAFGVGYEGRYGGIDGRTGKLKKAPANLWPVLCPAPGQEGVGLVYGREMPDAAPGDDKAGYPITVQFNTRKLKLKEHSLRLVASGKAAGQPIACYTFDGHSKGMTGFLRCVCLLPKDPLQPNAEYEVHMEVDVSGKPWQRTWRFKTQAGSAGGGRGFRRRR